MEVYKIMFLIKLYNVIDNIEYILKNIIDLIK